MSDRADQVGPPAAEWQDRVRQVLLSYYRRTKHHLHRYAQGPGHLDWATQPDPFRTYTGAPTVDLPLLADALPASYGNLYVPGRVAPRRLDVNSLAILFELSLGLSAWKEYQGSRWALRCKPSRGNLHSTAGYLIVPPALAWTPASITTSVTTTAWSGAAPSTLALAPACSGCCRRGRSWSGCHRCLGARHGSMESVRIVIASMMPGM